MEQAIVGDRKRSHSYVSYTERTKQRESAAPVGNRSGSPTGRTAHFEQWKREGAIKSALQRISTRKLAKVFSANENTQMAELYSRLYFANFKTVWSLTQASRSDILSVPWIGPAKLKMLAADLKSRNIEPAWTREDS